MHTLQPGKRYVVTHPSDDGTFEAGDHIRLLEDGAILCLEARGWIVADDVPRATQGMAVVIDSEWAQQELTRLTAQLRILTEASK